MQLPSRLSRTGECRAAKRGQLGAPGRTARSSTHQLCEAALPTLEDGLECSDVQVVLQRQGKLALYRPDHQLIRAKYAVAKADLITDLGRPANISSDRRYISCAKIAVSLDPAAEALIPSATFSNTTPNAGKCFSCKGLIASRLAKVPPATCAAASCLRVAAARSAGMLISGARSLGVLTGTSSSWIRV